MIATENSKNVYIPEKCKDLKDNFMVSSVNFKLEKTNKKNKLTLGAKEFLADISIPT